MKAAPLFYKDLLTDKKKVIINGWQFTKKLNQICFSTSLLYLLFLKY